MASVLYPINIQDTPQTPLLHVAVESPIQVPNAQTRTNETALEIFGQPYQDLTDKVNFWMRATKYSLGITILTFFPGFGSFAAGLIPPTSVATPIGAGIIGLSVILGLPIIYFCMDRKAIINGQMKIFESVKEFKNTFEDFKLEPYDVKIKSVFESYLKMFSSINSESGTFFKATGKLYLMEELTLKLKEFNPDSRIVNEWEECKLRVSVDKFSGLNDSPWTAIGVENPSNESYNELEKTLSDQKPVNLEEEVTSFFKLYLIQILDL
jgi:hypothetical protein